MSTRQAANLCISHLELPRAILVPGRDGYGRLELEDELVRRLTRYLGLARPRLTLEREALFVSRYGRRMTYMGIESMCSDVGVCARTLRRSYLAHARQLSRRRPLS